jgi:hypothetical protein
MSRPTAQQSEALATALDVIALALSADEAAKILLLRTLRDPNDIREMRLIRQALAQLRAIGQREHNEVTTALQAADSTYKGVHNADGQTHDEDR